MFDTFYNSAVQSQVCQDKVKRTNTISVLLLHSFNW